MWRAVAAVPVVACVLLLAVADPTQAHSALIGSVPADRSVLAEAPRQLELAFSTPVHLSAGGLTLRDELGRNFAGLVGVPAASGDGRRYVVPLRGLLPDGSYILAIRGLARDGDPLFAELRFAVRSTRPAAGRPEPFHLLASDPEDGALLAAPPERVLLRFSRPVHRVLGVLVMNDREQPVAGERAYVDAVDPALLVVPLDGPLRAGTYKVVAYVYAADGAPANPVLYFAVQRVTPFPPPDPVPLAWIPLLGRPKTLLRALALASLLVLAGGALAAWYAPPGSEAGRWRALARAAAGMGAGALAGLLVLRVRSAGGGWVELLPLPIGWVPLLQMAFLLVAALPKQRESVRAAAAGLALLLHPLAGHAALPGTGGRTALLVAALHLLAAATWFGGACALLVLRPREGAGSWLREAGRRFARLALPAVVAMAATGALLAMDLSGSWQGFWASDWGRVVRWKAAGLLALAALGAWQQRWLARRDASPAPFLGRLRLELALGLALVLLAGTLATLNPVAGVFPQHVTRDGVTASLAVRPLVVGNNTITVRLAPDPGVRRVRVRFSMPPDYRMETTAFPVGPQTYVVVGNQLHGPGRIDVTVVVERGKRGSGPELIFPFRLEVPLPGR